MAWQRSIYNWRAKVWGQIGCWKQVLGPALRFHNDTAEATEVAIGVVVLNRAPELCPPRPINGVGGRSLAALASMQHAATE